MEGEKLRQEILKNKSKGVQYMLTHFDLIQELISEGETPSAIYAALLLSESPPPISKSQFHRHISKQKLVEESQIKSEHNTRDQEVETIKVSPNHDVLTTMKNEKVSIHDSGFDADELI
jgi:hypothetical protein